MLSQGAGIEYMVTLITLDFFIVLYTRTVPIQCVFRTLKNLIL